MMKQTPLYHALTVLFQRQHNLYWKAAVDAAESDRHDLMLEQIADEIEHLRKEYLPSGSGFDVGTLIDSPEGLERGYVQRLVLSTAYHHMDENGSNERWTEHKVIVLPDLAGGIYLKLTGQNYRGIKEYISDTFNAALMQTVPVAPCLGNRDNNRAVV